MLRMGAPFGQSMILHPLNRNLSVEAVAQYPDLPQDLKAKVDALWEAEVCQRGAAIFNGKIFSVNERTSGRIAGMVVEYRLLAAQRRCPELFSSLQVRPLGVSGVIESPDGLIFGRRSSDLAMLSGQWELAPSGGIDPDACMSNNHIDYLRQFQIELEEETGIASEHVVGLTPCILVEDQQTHVLDLVVAAHTRLLSPAIQAAFATAGREYSELSVVSRSTVSRFVAEQSPDVVSTTAPILQFLGIEVECCSSEAT